MNRIFLAQNFRLNVAYRYCPGREARGGEIEKDVIDKSGKFCAGSKIDDICIFNLSPGVKLASLWFYCRVSVMPNSQF